MKTNNLSYLCKCLGWQGGTIHQVSEELSKYNSKELCKPENLINMNKNCMDLLLYFRKVKKHDEK